MYPTDLCLSTNEKEVINKKATGKRKQLTVLVLET